MLNEYENYLKLHVGSIITAKEYVKRIKHFFSIYNEFNQANINAYLTSLIDANKKSAFNLSMASFKKYCLFKKIQIEFPKQKKITRKTLTNLTRDEIEKEIIPYFKLLFNDGDKRTLIFRFMMLTLMRISEVVVLKKDDIDFETGKISIKHAKGDKHRETFIHPEIRDDLQKVIINEEGDSAFNISISYIEYMFSKINNELGYKKHITPHTTRRAGSRFLRDSGILIEELQKILGHESLETTSLYLITDIDDIQKKYNKIKYLKKGK